MLGNFGMLNQCHFGDCIDTMRRMPGGIVQTCVTSPPYFGLRDGCELNPAYKALQDERLQQTGFVFADDSYSKVSDSYSKMPIVLAAT